MLLKLYKSKPFADIRVLHGNQYVGLFSHRVVIAVSVVSDHTNYTITRH